MKNPTIALLLPIIATVTMATGGCSLFHHHQSKSSWKIINQGDRNPFITETPQETVDTPTRKVEVETGPVNPQWNSRKTEYALRALVALSRRAGSFQIQELSEKENIPIKYLEQILLTLRHAGFLTSKRGVGGGYSLRVSPSRINVGEIIEIMDGPIAPVPCAALRPLEKCSCPDPRTCAVRLLMTDLREEITALLGARTIEDMAKLSPDSSALAFEI